MQLLKYIELDRWRLFDALRGFLGGTLSILLLLQLTHTTNHLWIMAPFGATCVLLYAAPSSPLAQPKNVILGHLIAATVGLVFLQFFVVQALTIAIAVGIAIALMQLLKCIHPPAGANPLLILLTSQQVDYDWSFLIFPVLLGAITLVLVAKFMDLFIRYLRRSN